MSNILPILLIRSKTCSIFWKVLWEKYWDRIFNSLLMVPFELKFLIKKVKSQILSSQSSQQTLYKNRVRQGIFPNKEVWRKENLKVTAMKFLWNIVYFLFWAAFSSWYSVFEVEIVKMNFVIDLSKGKICLWYVLHFKNFGSTTFPL